MKRKKSGRPGNSEPKQLQGSEFLVFSSCLIHSRMGTEEASNPKTPMTQTNRNPKKSMLSLDWKGAAQQVRKHLDKTTENLAVSSVQARAWGEFRFHPRQGVRICHNLLPTSRAVSKRAYGKLRLPSLSVGKKDLFL